ncbi:MAG: hypothetical protein AABY33_09810 [Pseudomonadota bacterium]
MDILRKLIIVFLCASVFADGMAHASMPCCLNQDDISIQMKMKGDAEKPCHDSSDKDTKSTASCDGCDCSTCTKVSALPSTSIYQERFISSVIPPMIQFMGTGQLQAIFQPPRQLS